MEEVRVPAQACWMVRKILGTKEMLHILHNEVVGKKSMIRQAYKQMLGSFSKVEWRNLICCNSARPKAIFTIWLQAQNRLLTKDRMLKWKMQVEPVCVMCNQEEETSDHLFYDCIFARMIWRRLLQWINQNSNSNVIVSQQWIIVKTKGKNPEAQALRLIYAEYIYTLWKERNTRIFEKHETTMENIARRIACVCCVRANITARLFLDKCSF
ncbi:hypothetical protein MTR67_039382 [Solanum verrucosum]|uniref:Reverse transcriptase zinc-binding domain-containing protein n=1 Tax=Solanum verrucosum TaxID=315347 RepID=A0AAF0UH39_SOLVR|nr:hypothetical protein MTR67_039382 [Solanum verrucosum]